MRASAPRVDRVGLQEEWGRQGAAGGGDGVRALEARARPITNIRVARVSAPAAIARSMRPRGDYDRDNAEAFEIPECHDRQPTVVDENETGRHRTYEKTMVRKTRCGGASNSPAAEFRSPPLTPSMRLRNSPRPGSCSTTPTGSARTDAARSRGCAPGRCEHRSPSDHPRGRSPGRCRSTGCPSREGRPVGRAGAHRRQRHGRVVPRHGRLDRLEGIGVEPRVAGAGRTSRCATRQHGGSSITRLPSR